ncbi:Calmodulin [Bienertia sinuspersici]
MIPDTSATILSNDGASDRNRKFYAGNINYIFDIHNEKDLAMADIEAIMYVYGVENASAMEIVKYIQPKRRGIWNMNSCNKDILLAKTIKFTDMKEPLCILRHGSKCYQENLLSPVHFVGYIIHVLKQRYVDFETRFMILGMPSILGVLEGSTSRGLTTKDVETFVRLWKVTKPEEAKGLINLINDYDGNISCWRFYNLLYQQDMFGKQQIEMFDTQGQQNPSMFFTLIDKDGDGFLSPSDFRSFADIFGLSLSDQSIERVTRKFDMDGDGQISLEDFGGAMKTILDGITWEFWLVTILITLDL